jgi:tRNA(Ile)-lysidine synthetase-like protein
MLNSFNKNLIKNNDTLILAISGGIDSMVMLDHFIKLKNEMNLNLIIGHVDHQKRKNSKKDLALVKEIAKEYDIPFVLHKLEHNDEINFHQDAHVKRYDFFYKVAKSYKADKIALAHHLDDLAETIMMRLVRGTSFEGYRGILETAHYRDIQVIRPMLNIDKREIIEYQKENKIRYRKDESNDSDDYTRNRFRHKIMPELKKENPQLLDKFKQFSEYQNKAYQFIEDHSLSFIKNIDFNNHETKIGIEHFKALSDIVQIDVIKKIINHLTDNQLELSYTNIQDIIALFYQDKPHMEFHIGKDLFINKSYDIIQFSTQDTSHKNYEFVIKKSDQKIVNSYIDALISKKQYKTYDYIYKLCYNNLDLVFPISIRNRRNGDRLNIKIGTKKLKDFFIDKKIPLEIRDTIPLVVDKNNQILFIPGLYQLDTQGKETTYIHLNKTNY